jgi:hypothetical protein
MLAGPDSTCGALVGKRQAPPERGLPFYFLPWPGGLPPWPGALPECPGGLAPWPGALPLWPGALPLLPGALPLWPGALPLLPGELGAWSGELGVWLWSGAGDVRDRSGGLAAWPDVLPLWPGALPECPGELAAWPRATPLRAGAEALTFWLFFACLRLFPCDAVAFLAFEPAGHGPSVSLWRRWAGSAFRETVIVTKGFFVEWVW